MEWKPKLISLAVVAAAALGPGLGASALAVVLVGLLWLSRYVDGVWRGALHGAIGGLAAGLVVLGPGLRIVMRVVAILDPIREPEFTAGGSLFILVFVGAMLGTIFGTASNTVRLGWRLPLSRAWVLPALAVMASILVDSELRSEVFELGLGAWLNIPMFSAAAAAYGVAVMGIVGRLESRRHTRLDRRGQIEVPA